jgi:hypothetical protein
MLINRDGQTVYQDPLSGVVQLVQDVDSGAMFHARVSVVRDVEETSAAATYIPRSADFDERPRKARVVDKPLPGWVQCYGAGQAVRIHQ